MHPTIHPPDIHTCTHLHCAGGGGNSLAQFEKKKKAASQRAGRHDKVSIEGRGLSLRGA
jgi:hypothetical protein